MLHHCNVILNFLPPPLKTQQKTLVTISPFPYYFSKSRFQHSTIVTFLQYLRFLSISDYHLWVSCRNSLQFLASDFMCYSSFCSFYYLFQHIWQWPQAEVIPFCTTTTFAGCCYWLWGHRMDWERVFVLPKTSLYLLEEFTYELLH